MLRSSRTCASRARGAAAVAEQPLEHHARIGLHRHRRRSALRHEMRVDVDAAVAVVAVADQVRSARAPARATAAACPCRAPARRSDRRSCRRGRRRLRCASGARRSARRCSRARGRRCRRRTIRPADGQPAQHDDLVANGSSGFSDRRQLELARRRRPASTASMDHAVRDVDEAEPPRRLARRRSRSATSAGTIASSNGSASVRRCRAGTSAAAAPSW